MTNTEAKTPRMVCRESLLKEKPKGKKGLQKAPKGSLLDRLEQIFMVLCKKEGVDEALGDVVEESKKPFKAKDDSYSDDEPQTKTSKTSAADYAIKKK